MKPLYWGVGILTALLALCLVAAASVSAGSLRTERALLGAQAAARAGDMDLAREKAAEARRCWEARIDFIDAVTSHEETDEITRGLAELEAFAENAQRQDFLALCARLTVQTTHLRQMERACWYNILTAELLGSAAFLCKQTLHLR